MRVEGGPMKTHREPPFGGRRGAPGGARVGAALLLLAGAAAGALALRADRFNGFPHQEHAGLFPLCTGCHEGVPAGDRSEFYPEPEQCAGCHDGTELARVEWSPPARTPGNLRFDHAEHAAEIGATEERLECVVCHTREQAPRMAVERAVAERCIECHAHEATAHLVDADCATCHVPLAETRFPLARIAALPEPPGHDQPDFLTELHGELAREQTARCTVCHTRETCTTCHVDPARYAVIGRLPEAPADMELPPAEPRYFLPPSHMRADWLEAHGAAAMAARASCSTCHTRETCTTCHAARTPAVVAALPSRSETRAPGVGVSRRAPESHVAPFFEREHGGLAAAAPAQCATCHSRVMCEECHAAPATGRPGPTEAAGATAEAVLARAFPREGAPRPGAGPQGRGPAAPARRPSPEDRGEPDSGDTLRPAPGQESADRQRDDPPRAAATRTIAPDYHPPDFIARHATQAWGRTLECSNCHDTGAFCRDCHEGAGMGPRGRLGRGFHDAQPVWLLRHGQAARQGLESCASCHAQRDCMQCHSELGAFQVNPHGRDFDPERFRGRSSGICLACHLSDPFGRRTP